MVCATKYNLVITNVNDDTSITFSFMTILEVKQFMKRISNVNNYFTYVLTKITFNWNMETGLITQSSEEVIL